MKMRATVTRDVGTEEDPYGGRVPSIVTIHELLPCYVQPRRASTVTDSGKYISVELLMMWAPLDVDLEAEDTVTRITNLAGRVLWDGKRRVNAPPLQRETHLEAMLEEYS